MTKTTKRYLEIIELPDDFDISNLEKIKEATSKIGNFIPFIWKNEIYTSGRISTAKVSEWDSLISVDQKDLSNIIDPEATNDILEANKISIEGLKERILQQKNKIGLLETEISNFEKGIEKDLVLELVAAANGNKLK